MSLSFSFFFQRADGSIALTGSSSSSSSSSDSIVTMSTSELRAEQKRAKLAAAFGQAADAASLEKILSAGSKHADLVHESAASIAAQEALFNYMEKKESMAVQMDSITEQQVKAYRCLEPGCKQAMSEFPLAGCRARGHRCERVDAQKRFFSCQNCKFHLATIQQKLPTHSCHKCGGTIWLKASMIPMVREMAQEPSREYDHVLGKFVDHSPHLFFPFSHFLLSQKLDGSDRTLLQIKSEEVFLRANFG